MKNTKPNKSEWQDICHLGAQSVSLPPRLEALRAYWLQKCAGRSMPARDDLPVQELKSWLGHLALIEIAGENAYRVRLCGTNLIRRFGREATGAEVHELAFDIAKQMQAILKATVKAAAPIVAVSHVRLGRSLNTYSEVALPLSGPGGRIATVMLGSYMVRES